MKTLFIVGPMSSEKDDNWYAFYRAEAHLFEAGYDVINPYRLSFRHPTGRESWEFNREVMTQAVNAADGLALLPQYQTSPNCLFEVDLAVRKGIPVHYVSSWCIVPHAKGGLPYAFD